MFRDLFHLITDPQPESAYRRKQYRFKKLIGSYFIYSYCVIVGKGNFGEVKEALHIQQNSPCAIKIIRKKGDDQQRFVQKEVVQREIRILKELRHENVIAMLDHFETKRKYFIVFEL